MLMLIKFEGRLSTVTLRCVLDTHNLWVYRFDNSPNGIFAAVEQQAI